MTYNGAYDGSSTIGPTMLANSMYTFLYRGHAISTLSLVVAIRCPAK